MSLPCLISFFCNKTHLNSETLYLFVLSVKAICHTVIHSEIDLFTGIKVGMGQHQHIKHIKII